MLYKEVQRFDQWWLWLPLGLLTLACLYALMWHWITPDSELPIGYSYMGPLMAAAIMLLTVILLYRIRLKTEIDQKEIRIKFLPFVSRTFSWNEVQSARIIEYGFVGGWGIRLFTRYGTVYNIKGGTGLFLELKNGKTILMGTQDPIKLSSALSEIPQYHNDPNT